MKSEKKEIKATTDLDPSTIKRSGRDNKINLNDLKEFIGDVSFSPSARRYINENDIEHFSRHYRSNLMSSIVGIKQANLIGTVGKNKIYKREINYNNRKQTKKK